MGFPRPPSIRIHLPYMHTIDIQAISAKHLTLNTYHEKAMTFRLPSADDLYALLNLGSECGELLGLAAKARRDGAKQELVDLAQKELGDILWMCAAIADDMGIKLGDAALGNLLKLESRAMRNQIQGSGDNR